MIPGLVIGLAVGLAILGLGVAKTIKTARAVTVTPRSDAIKKRSLDPRCHPH